ncbi:evolutionarily conserved signaling intermediate in Toll pathway, mitochondrial-like [Haliotis rufescens]|uniref:evolutionarily conserved signaling intermediate in Toll pathway, mitochondrial-like n=1 Tax=Haliotis rufescens TaxID=6454 RepID=UPI00201EF871|nr:evolutionarily conserved signaling intermediate in Toll pathway, mitochondrial-like [Haliotis rufescens]
MATLARSARWMFRKLSVHQQHVLASVQCRSLHTCYRSLARDVQTYKTEQQLQSKAAEHFDEIARLRETNKLSFEIAVDMYVAKESVYRRGHVEFLYSALGRMKDFKVVNDLATYKKLLEIFPPEKMIPKSSWQVELMHYPRQQQCAIDLMEQMEDNGVIPDHEFGSILKKVFGPDAHAFRKYRRMMYWLPKFKNANPYPVPKELPEDPCLLAALALKRMAIDKENVIDMWKTIEVEMEPLEDTFVVSAQSPAQQQHISEHPRDVPLFVEGGYKVWLRGQSLTYFILRADPALGRVVKEEKVEEDLFGWQAYDSEERDDLMPAWSMHQQEDGTVMAMCITGSASKDSLVTWVRYLQRRNPVLEHIPVVFKLRTPDAELQPVPGTRTDLAQS